MKTISSLQSDSSAAWRSFQAQHRHFSPKFALLALEDGFLAVEHVFGLAAGTQ